MNKIDTTLMIEMCTYTLVRHKLADSNDDKLNLSISKTSYFKNHFSERSREQPLFVEKNHICWRFLDLLIFFISMLCTIL